MFACEYCNISYKSKACVQNHKNRHHRFIDYIPNQKHNPKKNINNDYNINLKKMNTYSNKRKIIDITVTNFSQETPEEFNTFERQVKYYKRQDMPDYKIREIMEGKFFIFINFNIFKSTLIRRDLRTPEITSPQEHAGYSKGGGRP